MIDRGEEVSLAPEPREPFGIVRDAHGQDFQRDVAIEFRVTSAVDLSHAA
jgi:hypothetical protein